MLADGTLLRPLAGPVAQPRPTASAELMAAIPFGDLEGATGKREQWIGYLEEERAQPAPLAACGFGGVRRDPDRDAIDALEASEIMSCALDGQPRGGGGRGTGRR